jgi:hypothetical protein
MRSPVSKGGAPASNVSQPERDAQHRGTERLAPNEAVHAPARDSLEAPAVPAVDHACFAMRMRPQLMAVGPCSLFVRGGRLRPCGAHARSWLEASQSR